MLWFPVVIAVERVDVVGMRAGHEVEGVRHDPFIMVAAASAGQNRRGELTAREGHRSSGAARQGAVEPARYLPYGDVELAAVAMHEQERRRARGMLVEHG